MDLNVLRMDFNGLRMDFNVLEDVFIAFEKSIKTIENKSYIFNSMNSFLWSFSFQQMALVIEKVTKVFILTLSFDVNL